MNRNSKAWFALLNGRVLVCKDVSQECSSPFVWLEQLGYSQRAIDNALGGHMDDSGVYFYRLANRGEEIYINSLAVSTIVTWYTGNFGKRPDCVYSGLKCDGRAPLYTHLLSEFHLGIPMQAVECSIRR